MRSRQSAALLLPAGKGVGQIVKFFLQPQSTDNVHDKLLIYFSSIQSDGQDNVLPDIDRRNKIKRLKDKTER